MTHEHKGSIIDPGSYIAFLQIIRAVGDECADEVALLMAEASTQEIERWRALLLKAIEVADKRGAQRVADELTTLHTPAPRKNNSPFTDEELKFVSSFKNARGAKLPDLMERYIMWRLRKGEKHASLMKRFHVSWPTLKALRERLEQITEAEAKAAANGAANPNNPPPSRAMPAHYIDG